MSAELHTFAFRQDAEVRRSFDPNPQAIEVALYLKGAFGSILPLRRNLVIGTAAAIRTLQRTCIRDSGRRLARRPGALGSRRTQDDLTVVVARFTPTGGIGQAAA